VTTELLGASRIDGPAACSKILLVGELNPYGAEARYALYHEPRQAAGFRLQHKILGVNARHTYLPMWRTNLCAGSWQSDEAAKRASTLTGPGAPWKVVVMLGVKVVKAFSGISVIGKLEMFSSVTVEVSSKPVMTFVALPHPSGRNTIWNGKGAVQLARRLLAAAAPDIHWGEIDTTTGEP
jgi:hypothetical protein